MPNHFVRFRDPNGVYIADITGRDAITGYLRVASERKVNDEGLLYVELDGAHDIIRHLDEDVQMEFWRRSRRWNIPWYAEMQALYETMEIRKAGTRSRATLIARDAYALLNRYNVAYPANTNRRSAWTNVPVETIATEIVRYNATTDANANTIPNGGTRKCGIGTPYITVATDQGRGAVTSFAHAWDDLLPTLRDACQGQGDISMTKTGARSWQFAYAPGHLGQDQRATLTWAPGLGNMLDVVYTEDRTNAGTMLIVMGQGDEENRLVVTVTTPGYDPAYHREQTIDARHIPGKDANDIITLLPLQAYADRLKLTYSIKRSLSFTPRQSDDRAYGRDYGLGDLTRARYLDQTFDYKVVGASIVVENHKEDVHITLEPYG